MPGQRLKLLNKHDFPIPDAFRGPLALGWRGWSILTHGRLSKEQLRLAGPTTIHIYICSAKKGGPSLQALVEQMQTVCPEQLPYPYLAQQGRRELSSLRRTRNLSAELTAAAASWSLTREAAPAFGLALLPLPLPCSVCCCVFLPHLGVVGDREMKCFSLCH